MRGMLTCGAGDVGDHRRQASTAENRDSFETMRDLPVRGRLRPEPARRP
jgi:hypothetical protein